MANYISIPIIDQLITFLESGEDYEGNMRAMLSAVLNHYYTATGGYYVIPRPSRSDIFADFTVCRIRTRFPGNEHMVVHTLVKSKHESNSLADAQDELARACDNLDTENGRCWAILAIGENIVFYMYHRCMPVGRRLIHFSYAGHRSFKLHIRIDSDAIDCVLNYMRQRAGPNVIRGMSVNHSTSPMELRLGMEVGRAKVYAPK
ncbi:hypothetical protein N7454_004964 [Penicillium verhagenii]|nr:hypothetical protein N7454_004964 [Penicillium verhagenii]